MKILSNIVNRIEKSNLSRKQYESRYVDIALYLFPDIEEGDEIDFWRNMGPSWAEAFIDSSDIRKLQTKLGKPTKKTEDTSIYWNFKPDAALKKLGVKSIYIENYKNRSKFLVVEIK